MKILIKRGDIFYADLNPVVGSEQGGIRPVLVVQNNVGNRHSPTVIVVPISSVRKKNLPVHIQIRCSELPKNSTVLAEQIRTIDRSRLKTQKFGVEIECTGLTRSAAAKAVAKVIGGSPEHFGGSYDRYDVYDNQNRRWKIMSDASIRCTNKNGNPASKLYSVELVTPILEYGDMATLQEVVRSIRRSGGICNESTGIHIHIDFEPYDAQKLRNLVNIFASKEDMLYQALQVNSEREQHYCRKVDKRFLEEINRRKPTDLQTIKRLWYKDDADYHSHYDPSRYVQTITAHVCRHCLSPLFPYPYSHSSSFGRMAYHTLLSHFRQL